MKISSSSVTKSGYGKILKLLGKIIKERRIEIDLTAAALAEKVGVSTLQLRKIEQGSGNPILLVYMKLSSALGLDFTKILHGKVL
jgi:transcriptional regulator with XRE-family HTH domain